MDLKKFLKNLKLNESSISMVLGALVIIIVGVLVVNYVKDNKGLLPGTGVSENQTAAGTHTVLAGETLWSIAEKYYGDGYKWVDIAQVNSLESPDVIEEGQVLTLPEEMMTQEAEATVASQAAPAPEASPAVQDSSYTVVKGDHLWGIAVRTYGDGYKWVDIARANNLKNPNLLFVDTVLTLPR